MAQLDIPRRCRHISRLFQARVATRAARARRVTYRIDLETSVPNIRSAKKDMRKSRAAAIRNRAQRSALRTALKKSLAPSASPDERLSAVSLLDRAARKGLIHANKAARHKAQIARIAK
jgi:small subunit ribosomal protein S20